MAVAERRKDKDEPLSGVRSSSSSRAEVAPDNVLPIDAVRFTVSDHRREPTSESFMVGLESRDVYPRPPRPSTDLSSVVVLGVVVARGA